jgi:ABC-type lipoprotein release transport system permease subunit
MLILMSWRNIWRNKTRSIIIMLSIVVGLFAGIAVQALYKGMMKDRVRSVIDAEVGHLQVHDPLFLEDYDPAFIIKNGPAVLQKISSTPGVKLACPRTIVTGMLATATGSAGVQINGVVPDLEYAASQLRKKIVEGGPFSPGRMNQVMIGKKLATKMKLKTGAKLVLTFTDTAGNIVSGAFRVKAIYQSNNTPMDEKNVYVTREDLGNLLMTGGAFHEISILLHKDEELSTVEAKIKKQLPGYLVENWQTISPETDLLVKTTNQYSYIIMVIIMVALAFGIINTMLMAVLERTREIGMMVALGTSKTRIFLLVLLETIFLTLAGLPIGLLISWFVVRYYNIHGLDLSGMGEEMMSSFGFGNFIYPEFPADKLAGVIIIVTTTAVLSSLLPALKALRLQPVDALKSGLA